MQVDGWSAVAFRVVEGAATAGLYVQLAVCSSTLSAWWWGVGWNVGAGLLSVAIAMYNRTAYAASVLEKADGKQD